MTDRTPDTVIIETTLEQADAVRSALDLFTRVGLGQLEEIASLARFGSLMARDGDRPAPMTLDSINQLEALLVEAKRVLGHPTNGSFGVGAKIHPEFHRAYEVQKVLDQALTLHRNPADRGVRSDGLGPRYTQDPAPKAKVIAGE